MNKQKMFDNFIERVNGKGKSLFGKFCVYCPVNHPGCAIGCQPELDDPKLRKK